MKTENARTLINVLEMKLLNRRSNIAKPVAQRQIAELGLIGMVRVLLAARSEEARGANSNRVKLRDDPIVVVLILLLVSVMFAFGIFPQSVAHLAWQMAEGFTFFTP